MEWLQQLLGEELYNTLPKEVLEKFGNTEYVKNDPTKIIPKNVFNEKLSVIKTLETQIETYKKQIENYGTMVTDTDMKTQLQQQKIEFEAQIKQIKKDAENKRIIDNKKYLMNTYLQKSGCQYPDLIIDKINFDDVVMDNDNKNILNGDNIVLPLKENYKNLFETKITGNIPKKGQQTPIQQPTSREALIQQYNDAEKVGNSIKMMQLQRQIKEFKE